MRLSLRILLALSLLLGRGFAQVASAPPKGEPTNAAEAAAQKEKTEAEVDAKYQSLVARLPPDQQAWERVLESQLGGFYLPLHKRAKIAGQSTAWDFVQDDPTLPRVLLIGDSVSRGYTQAARKALTGKANVHRAPANCGATASGIKNIEVWLGDGKWEVIHFNFGIHDRNTPLADYTQRLEQLIVRMKKTGARLVWASTTPIPDDLQKKQTAASIVERNQAAANLMQKHDVAIDDLFGAITPHLAEMQNPNDVHFNAAGYDFLGETVAANIRIQLSDGDAAWLLEHGALMFHDSFDREETGNDAKAIGNGWNSATADRVPQIKMSDLDGGVLKIASASEEAGHAAHIHHEAVFTDGGVMVRFKFPGLTKSESLQLGFVDRETKNVHAGHLCYAVLAAESITLMDWKTGVMDIELRKRRQPYLDRKEPLPADLDALLKTKQVTVKWKPDTEWHDLVLVTEGDEMRLSLDGELLTQHRSPGFAHPTKRWFSFLVPGTVWIDDVEIRKVK